MFNSCSRPDASVVGIAQLPCGEIGLEVAPRKTHSAVSCGSSATTSPFQARYILGDKGLLRAPAEIARSARAKHWRYGDAQTDHHNEDAKVTSESQTL